jgi:hypothetical protein
MSDLNEIAGRIVQALIPFLPYLLRIGDAAADEVGRRMGAAAWERARALWERLYPRRSVEPVAQAVVASPDNRALREALREEIARALAEDPALCEEVIAIYSQVETGDVKPSGEVTGVRVRGKSPQGIHSEVKTGDVAGKVTGVEIHDE